MAADYRYVRHEASYLPVAKIALENHFLADEDLQVFYDAIATPARKNQFLRAASFYYYAVKQGDWVVSAPDCNPIVDYFTNSYKAVGLFSIIESLSDGAHQDFYSWLQTKRDTALPIPNLATLDALYGQYKSTYGSIRKCVSFFSRLSVEMQAKLCSAVEIERRPVENIKKLAQFLYHTRSKFVHEAEVVLQFSGSMYDFRESQLVCTKLTMPLFLSAFEEGLVAYFCDAAQETP